MSRLSRQEQRAEELSGRYPHYRTYTACQSQAFMLGSLTLVGGAAVTYVGMDQWFQRFKPNISRNWLVAVPFLGGIVVAYITTMKRSAICQKMWMAMEERHSDLTPASERLAERIEAERKTMSQSQS